MVWVRYFTCKGDVNKCQNNIIVRKKVHSQVIYLTGNWSINWKKDVNLVAMGIIKTNQWKTHFWKNVFFFTLDGQCIYKKNIKNRRFEIKINYPCGIIVYFWYFCGTSKTENVITEPLLLFWYILIEKMLNSFIWLHIGLTWVECWNW